MPFNYFTRRKQRIKITFVFIKIACVLIFIYFLFFTAIFILFYLPARNLQAGIAFGDVCLPVCLSAQNIENYWLEIDVAW